MRTTWKAVWSNRVCVGLTTGNPELRIPERNRNITCIIGHNWGFPAEYPLDSHQSILPEKQSTRIFHQAQNSRDSHACTCHVHLFLSLQPLFPYLSPEKVKSSSNGSSKSEQDEEDMTLFFLPCRLQAPSSAEQGQRRDPNLDESL